MHVGRNNPGFDYYFMNGVKRMVVEEEKDVGGSLKPAQHCQRVAAMGDDNRTKGQNL
jgi:hypothetical protein